MEVSKRVERNKETGPRLLTAGSDLQLPGSFKDLWESGAEMEKFSFLTSRELNPSLRFLADGKLPEKESGTSYLIKQLEKQPEWDQKIPALVKMLMPELYWAWETATGSFSYPDAGIGYHADNYHVLVLQVEGSKRWSVWNESVLSETEKKVLRRENPRENTGRLSMPDTVPQLEHELKAGEALFIPALFPHSAQSSSQDHSWSISLVFHSWTKLKIGRSIRHLKPQPLSMSLMETLLNNAYVSIDALGTPEAETRIQESLEETCRELDLLLSNEQKTAILANLIRKP